jgi:hypothetical protein
MDALSVSLWLRSVLSIAQESYPESHATQRALTKA